MRSIFLFLVLSVLLAACKKDKDKKSGNGLVSSISNGVSSAQLFSYDAQKRLIRTDYSAAFSLRFEYSGAGVLIQGYDGANNPVADSRYDFTIIGGKIANGNRYRPGNITDKYYFEYDAQQRLTQAIISKTFNGTENEQHRYWISYDAGNNVQSIGFRRTLQGKNDDSIHITRTYYENKSFIRWKDIGFDYFGSAAVGQPHLGYGITMPLFVISNYYPSEHALKSVAEENFHWNILTNKWVADAPNGYTRDENLYKYDQRGRFIGHDGDTIEWE